MNVFAEAKRPQTTAEFLVWPGDGRAKKYQLVDGEVLAMSPGNAVHGLIQATMASLIRTRLKEQGGPCRVLTEPAVIPRVLANNNVRVPDLAVTCVPVAAGQMSIEPTVVVEILSPSNARKTWANIYAYTTIPSVKEIVIVQSTRIEIQVLRPSHDRIWPDRPETIGAGTRLRLESIGLDCRIEDVYSDTPLV